MGFGRKGKRAGHLHRLLVDTMGWHAVAFELKLTHWCIFITLLATAGFFGVMGQILAPAVSQRSFRSVLEISMYVLFVSFLTYGNLLYQCARIGYLKRLARHRRATDEELRSLYAAEAPALTFLIPSYKEEARVIRQALLSAALQEYPNREVVLLIDDPATPTAQHDIEGLRRSRELPAEIQSLLRDAHARYGRAWLAYLQRQSQGRLDLQEECFQLSQQYRAVARWFETQAKEQRITDHTDALFTEKILQARATWHHAHAEDLLQFMSQLPCVPRAQAETRIRQEYRRLATLFAAQVSSFERKRYRNISHEPNKAMNLNAYISLMGKGLQEVAREDGLYLEEAPHPTAGVQMRDATYLITLDADSLLLPEYALRLIHLLESPGHEKVAVIQTPYSAVPNPHSRLERIAGATTDVQYFIHQGSTYYRATFWVGANAVLRKAALDDLATSTYHNGHLVKKYIQDRTLIEDTESTIDLIPTGWILLNYPERLSYSATPADFGALLVQRGRWANGGLLLIPKLLTYAFTTPRSWGKFCEVAFRLYYLSSLAGVSLGYLLIVAWPYVTQVNTWWLLATAFPYYLLYMRDLHRAGYQRKAEVLRVCALNLLLVPVHLLGSLKSLYQACTGNKSVFKRTPKVLERTSVPGQYLIWGYGLLAWLIFGVAWDFSRHHWLDGAFALSNAAGLSYAIWGFIGWRDTLADMKLSVHGQIWQPLQRLRGRPPEGSERRPCGTKGKQGYKTRHNYLGHRRFS